MQEGQYRFRRANTDSGGQIRIQEGKYGPFYELYKGQYKTVYAFKDGQYGNLLEI